MDDKSTNQWTRGIPEDGHDKSDRHNAIRALLTNDEMATRITTLKKMAKYLSEYHNIITTESTLAKDKKSVKFEKITDKGKSYFVLSDTGKRDIIIEELQEICTHANITANDINKDVSVLILNTNGYSPVVSNKLKRLFPDNILEIICLDNSLIIYYKSQHFAKELEKVLT